MADLLGDHAFAQAVRAAGATLRRAVAAQWTGRWFNRGYKGTTPYGVDALYLNAQPWALLAGAATARQAATLAGNVERLLSRPSPIGAVAESRSQGYARPRERPTGIGPTGGVWYALNGPAVWALGAVAPALAYREYKDNTRAAYAQAYPDNWYVVLSGPDSYDSVESTQAGQPFLPGYPMQDLHAHAWEVYATLKEAGIQPTEGGYTINPHWPAPNADAFTLDTAVIGVAYAGRRVNGYLRPEGSGVVALRVRVPAGAGAALVVRVDGAVVPAHMGGGFVAWHMAVAAERDTSWVVTA